MRIALTHPWCWPWVQRGGERMFADLSSYLADAGHEVTTISAGPRGSRRRDGRVVEIVHRSPRIGPLRRFDIDQAVTYLPQAAADLRRTDPDVVHGMYHLDGIAARMARVRPYLVHIQGMPRRAAAAGRPVHRRLLPASLKGAAVVVAVSQAAADTLEEEFGVHARAVHNGVYTERFAVPGGPRAGRPTVLFPGSIEDPRKRFPVLLAAVRHLEHQWPGLVVAVAQHTDATTRAALTGPIEYLELTDPGSMPAAYAHSWVTCLPAVDEAFGLVLIESLASGRPAVGVADGGVPEVLAEPSWLARPDDPEDLAAALDRALTASERPGTAERCRDLSRPFDWSVRGPAFEAVYQEMTS